MINTITMLNGSKHNPKDEDFECNPMGVSIILERGDENEIKKAILHPWHAVRNVIQEAEDD